MREPRARRGVVELCLDFGSHGRIGDHGVDHVGRERYAVVLVVVGLFWRGWGTATVFWGGSGHVRISSSSSPFSLPAPTAAVAPSASSAPPLPLSLRGGVPDFRHEQLDAQTASLASVLALVAAPAHELLLHERVHVLAGQRQRVRVAVHEVHEVAPHRCTTATEHPRAAAEVENGGARPCVAAGECREDDRGGEVRARRVLLQPDLRVGEGAMGEGGEAGFQVFQLHVQPDITCLGCRPRGRGRLFPEYEALSGEISAQITLARVENVISDNGFYSTTSRTTVPNPTVCPPSGR